MKDELKEIFSSLPKRIIIALLIIALGLIVSLVGYIGKSWYNNWQQEQELNSVKIQNLETVIIDGFQSTQDEFVKQNMMIMEMKQKQNIIIDQQSTATKKQLKQIETIFKELKKVDEVKKNDESDLIPVKPNKAILLTYNVTSEIYFPQDTIKKKDFLDEF